MALSTSRFLAILMKEFIQMRRDRMTFAMMIVIPIVQLMLFGFAINSDPRHLPTLVEVHDTGPFTRGFLAAMQTSTYFDIRGTVASSQEVDRALKTGEAAFVVTIPENFERDIVRGDKPALLVAADASDPATSGSASAALSVLAANTIDTLAIGPLSYLAGSQEAFSVIAHQRYNPAARTSYNIVPGLLAIIISMTMVMITAIAIVRESERGTMETLLSTPARAPEVMLGKIIPYVLIGYVQTCVFFILAFWVFSVPFAGPVAPFLLGLNIFIIVNLALGFLFSTIARNQMQAMQMSFFYLLPSILLSGFMFPFAAMPGWAQVLGTLLPSTHFMRVIRKIMLKGADLSDIVPDLRALLIILVAVSVLAMLRYKRTLD
ncbi:ABC transporter permease [Nitratireductor sp. XY-223]|uniref:ABC transporter permease n=1 Tax=Nitratireductor sp. XY-223 TaxID=2561926 RepID=UPI0010AA70E0|nr:ABC transporter permease [Nitratireductor sp. XY-223]